MTTDYEILPEGKYSATPVEAALGESKAGKPQVAVLFRINGGAHDGESITWFGSFSKNLGQGTKTPFQRTIEALRTCGWDGDDISELSSINEDKGVKVRLVVEHDEWEGKMSAKVKWVNRDGIGLATPMKTDKAKAFAASLRGEVLAASRNIKPATGNGVQREREPGEDDDIGF